MTTPINKELYEKVKKEASRKFISNSGIYRSSWIVREYKKRGGKYKGSKPKKTGLKRWYKEKWVDLNRPIYKDGKIVGYKPCGRKSTKKSTKKYPLCRPSKRVTSKTPKTHKELSKKQIKSAKKRKSTIKHKGNIIFGGKGKTSVVIKKSDKKGKKLMAVFTGPNGRKKTTHFGAEGMSDFTKHKDKERKQRYITRHRKNENWNDPMTAGALSRWVLWNKPSLRASISDFKKKFRLN